MDQDSQHETAYGSCLQVKRLKIDEWTIEDPNEPLPFLDIEFCFDHQGELQTDVKETHASRYVIFKLW